MTLFQRGDFTLASGAKASWKIECDALTPEDWDGLAAMLVDYLPHPFAHVTGVPRGGQPLADALRPYASSAAHGRLLVVDDVWTTGGSMLRYIEALRLNGTMTVERAVVFARNPVPVGVTALFSVPS